ncbi:hypothetical protein [Chryseobacterium sp.]|uniref:hypothetical protein n=1 Tax=Chryseobacterium sp. TaxID=1871047 RepID=UPI0028A13316|nr:hypothetical protein [Chryseobacterium sp.]
MKKLILMAAFAVAGTMSANTIAVETEKSAETKAQEAAKRTCVPVTLSCGITGQACGETTIDIIDIVIIADDILCGN